MKWRRGPEGHELRRYRWCLPEFRALTAEEFKRIAEDPALDRTGVFDDLELLAPVGMVWGFVLLAPSSLLVIEYFEGKLSMEQLTLALAPAFVGVLIPGVVVGAWLIRRCVRREVLGVFVPTNCPRCRFEIIGLEPEGGAVTCPECGHRTNTHGRRWAAERARPTLATPGSGGKRRKRRKRFAR